MIDENDNTILLTLNNNWNELHGGIRIGKLSEKLIDEVSILPQITALEDVIQTAEKKLKDGPWLS